MEKKRIMLTDMEILAVKCAILSDIRYMEKTMKILYGEDVNPECYMVRQLRDLKSALEKLDEASYGKKVK